MCNKLGKVVCDLTAHYGWIAILVSFLAHVF